MKLIMKGPKVESVIDPLLRVTCPECKSVWELRKKELSYNGMYYNDKKDWVSVYKFTCPICDRVTILYSDDIKEAQDAAINEATDQS